MPVLPRPRKARLFVAAGLFAFLANLPARSGAAEDLAVLGAWPRWTRISGLAQTPDGYLWIATSSGLARFDGSRFVTFARGRVPGLPSNDVRALLVARDGSLWIGLDEGGGLHRWDRGVLSAVDTGGALAGDGIRALAETGGGDILIGTVRGLHRLQKGRGLRRVATAEALGGAVNVLLAGVVAGDASGAPDEAVWVGTTGGLRLLRHADLGTVGDPGAVLALARARDGVIWVAQEGRGLLRVRAGEAPVLVPEVDDLGLGPARALRFDRAGTLHVGLARGLARLKAGRWQAFNLGNVDYLLDDHEGAMWAGRTGGLLRRLGRPRVQMIIDGNDPSVASLLAGPAGEVWMANNRRILRARRNIVTRFSQAEGLPSTGMRALALGRGGALWIGTQEQGAFRLEDDRVRGSGPVVALPDPRVSVMFEDRAGRLWIGGRYGGLAVFDGTSVRDPSFPAGRCPTGTPAADCAHAITAIVEDRRGNVWIGTRRDGLYQHGGDRFVRFGREQGLPSERILALFADAGGALWIGTEGAGLAHLDDGRFRVLGPEGGLPSANVAGLVEDGTGNLWMGAEDGVFRARKRDIEAYLNGQRREVRFITYDATDGMAAQRVSAMAQPTAARDQEGRVWFATMGGAAVFTPPEQEPPAPPPRVIVEEVRFGGHALSAHTGQGLALPAGRGTLEVRYTAPSFVAPHRVRFRYRLDGFDDGWVDAQDRRVAYFANLPPGTYSFLVRATCDDLDWATAEASFPFSVTAFYERPPFFVAVGLSLLALAWAAHRLRLRYMRARFGAVLDERNRIARDLHDSLAQYLAGIGWELERLSNQLKDSGSEKAKEILRDTKRMVKRCRLEARQTIWNLRTHDLDRRPLAQALGEMAKQLGLAGSAAVTVRVTGRDRPVAPETQAELVRIVQEATANALMHGRASQVVLAVSFHEDGTITMRIEDDGVGFEPKETPAPGDTEGMRFGLRGMHERAARIGARLRVESQPGQGTVVEVTDVRGGDAS